MGGAGDGPLYRAPGGVSHLEVAPRVAQMSPDWLARNAAQLRKSTHPMDYLSGVSLALGDTAMHMLDSVAGGVEAKGSKYTFSTMGVNEARILEGDYGAIRTAVSRHANRYGQKFRTEKQGPCVLVVRLA